MKKLALLLVVAAFAATPAAAAGKHHKKKAKENESVFAKQSANTARILRDGLPLVLPSWSLPVYFGTGMDTSSRTAAKHHSKHHKKKKM
jgi:hypothetical protein